jgi:sugar lactone lactonase YvrE
MINLKAEVAYPIRAIVGEGSYWDQDNQRLLWVDILDHKIYVFDPETKCNTGFDLGQDIGTVVMTESGLWAFADQDGIGFLNPQTGERIDGAKPEERNSHIRFNDGKCDPRGTLWAGTMAYSCETGAGKLYEFDAKGEVKQKISKATISNGLVWNDDSTKFYFIDSLSYQIHEYDYDIHTGDIKNKKIVASIDEQNGIPDGMAIDTENHLWVALFDGGKVIRINPENGETVFEVSVPVPKVTSCAFGGVNLDELYITTACHMMSADQLEAHPHSGSLFKVKVPFKGVLPYKMRS